MAGGCILGGFFMEEGRAVYLVGFSAAGLAHALGEIVRYALSTGELTLDGGAITA